MGYGDMALGPPVTRTHTDPWCIIMVHRGVDGRGCKGSVRVGDARLAAPHASGSKPQHNMTRQGGLEQQLYSIEPEERQGQRPRRLTTLVSASSTAHRSFTFPCVPSCLSRWITCGT